MLLRTALEKVRGTLIPAHIEKKKEEKPVATQPPGDKNGKAN